MTITPAAGLSPLPASFRQRGLLAPGMRLFRGIGFPAKAAWVTAAFLAPLLLMAATFWMVTHQGIDFAGREREGIRYVRALLPVLDAAQNRRRAATANAPDLPEAQARVAQAWQALAAAQQALGPQLGTAAAWQALVPLQEALAANPRRADAVSTFGAHTELVSALLELIGEAADGSTLTLDPDADTYHLMLAGTQAMPQLLEGLAQLRGTGNAVLRSGTLQPAQRDRLAAALAFGEHRLAELRRALRRAAEADPALARSVAAEAPLAQVQDFLERARTLLLGAAPSGADQAEGYVALANAAIGAAYGLNGRVLDALDAGIVRRVAALQSALWLRLAAVAAGLLLAAYLLVVFYRVTLAGIGEVGRQLEHIAQGDLTLEPRPWGRDEVAQLMNALARTLQALRRTVGQVRDGALQIENASAEVASASRDLSQRTEESAAHLQRTSSAMTQIGATVRSTADSAAGASALVERNAEVAHRGGQVMDEAIGTMGGIRESSARITDIVGTIDGLAFQTNILALNAAVEAARAGEAGRGFAVVAAEVRALAQRSAAAAREVRSLITRSVEQVEGGTRVVGEAGRTMAGIVEGAEQVKSLIAGISGGAREQTAGLGEISRSVEQLDAMTQQNAALVEQTAAAAASLQDNAERLAREMAFFRVA